MKNVIALSALLALTFAVPCLHAQTVSTYGGTTVTTGPDGAPAWQLTSEASGTTYSGIEIDFSSPLTPDQLTTLSTDYLMLQGTFGGGAPRFSIADSSGNEAWVYFGTPNGSGGFTDPNAGNTTYGNTGNFVTSTDAVVQNGGFGGVNSGYPYETWSDFLGQAGSTDISSIYIDLDGGFTGTQVADIADIDINGTIFNPAAAAPEPSSLLLFGTAVLGAAGMVRRRRIFSR